MAEAKESAPYVAVWRETIGEQFQLDTADQPAAAVQLLEAVADDPARHVRDMSPPASSSCPWRAFRPPSNGPPCGFLRGGC